MTFTLLKKTLIYFLAAILLVVGLSLAIVVFSSDNTRKYWLTQTVSRVLHRDLSIAGDFSLKLGSTIELQAEKISLRNPDWSSQPDLFFATKLDIRFDIFSVASSDLNYQIRLENAELFFETNAEGEASWNFDISHGKSDEQGQQLNWSKWLPTSVYARAIKIQFKNAQTGRKDLAVLDAVTLGNLDGQWHFDAHGKMNALPVNIETQLSGNTVDISGQFGKLVLSANGTIIEGKSGADSVVDLDWVVDSSTLKMFDAEIFEPVPDIGPLHASGRLHRLSGKYAVSDLNIDITDPLLKLQANGEIADVFTGAVAKLQVQLGTHRLTDLLHKLGLRLGRPLPDQANMVGQLAGGVNDLGVSGLKIQLDGQGLALAFSGEIDNLLTLKGIDIAVKGEAKALPSKMIGDIELLPMVAGLGPFDIAGRFVGDREVLALSDIDVQLQTAKEQLQLSGSIKDLIHLKGVAIELNGNLDDPGRWMQEVGVGAEINGPLKFHLLVAEATTTAGALSIEASLSTKAVLVKINGKLDDLIDPEKFQLALDVTAGQLYDLGQLFGEALPEIGPVVMRSKINRQQNKITLSGMQVTLADSDIRGDLVFLLADVVVGSKPALTGSLESRVLNLRALVEKDQGITIEQGGVAATDEELALESKNRVFPTEDLPFDWLQEYRLDVGLKVDQLIAPFVTLDQLSTKVYLQHGLLQLEPFTASINDKPVTLDFSLDASHQPATFIKHLVIEGFDLDSLIVSDKLENAGVATINLSLEGTGQSIAEIMANLNGQVRLLIKDARLPSSMVNEMSESVLDQLNPISKKRDGSILECAAVFFDIKDGEATTPRGVAIKLSNVTWLGKGSIDLATERINIALKPKARKGLGISLNVLSDLVLIAGTLKQPRIQLDPEGVIGATANYAVAISTGGLSLLLVKLWDKNQANAPVCEYVIADEEDSGAVTKRGFLGRLLPNSTAIEEEDDEEYE